MSCYKAPVKQADGSVKMECFDIKDKHARELIDEQQGKINEVIDTVNGITGVDGGHLATDEDIQVINDNLEQNYVKNTDLPTETKGGAVKVASYMGVGVQNELLYSVPCTDTDISEETSNNYRTLQPKHISKIVKKGLTNSTQEWTDEDKANARSTIDAVGKTDYGTTEKVGIFKLEGGTGISASGSHALYLVSATEGEINSRTSHYKPIVPGNLDYAVKKGLSDSKITWSEEEKTKARQTLGVVDSDATVDLSEINTAIATTNTNVSNLQTEVDTLETNMSSYLPLSGGTMTGDIILKEDGAIFSSDGKKIIRGSSNNEIGNTEKMLTLFGSMSKVWYNNKPLAFSSELNSLDTRVDTLESAQTTLSNTLGELDSRVDTLENNTPNVTTCTVNIIAPSGEWKSNTSDTDAWPHKAIYPYSNTIYASDDNKITDLYNTLNTLMSDTYECSALITQQFANLGTDNIYYVKLYKVDNKYYGQIIGGGTARFIISQNIFTLYSATSSTSNLTISKLEIMK